MLGHAWCDYTGEYKRRDRERERARKRKRERKEGREREKVKINFKFVSSIFFFRLIEKEKVEIDFFRST